MFQAVQRSALINVRWNGFNGSATCLEVTLLELDTLCPEAPRDSLDFWIAWKFQVETGRLLKRRCKPFCTELWLKHSEDSVQTKFSPSYLPSNLPTNLHQLWELLRTLPKLRVAACLSHCANTDRAVAPQWGSGAGERQRQFIDSILASLLNSLALIKSSALAERPKPVHRLIGKAGTIGNLNVPRSPWRYSRRSPRRSLNRLWPYSDDIPSNVEYTQYNILSLPTVSFPSGILSAVVRRMVYLRRPKANSSMATVPNNACQTHTNHKKLIGQSTCSLPIQRV